MYKTELLLNGLLNEVHTHFFIGTDLNSSKNKGCWLNSTNVHEQYNYRKPVVYSPVCLWYVLSLTYSFPLVANVLGGEVGVGVYSRQLDSVRLSNLQDLAVDAQCGHALLVGFGQSGLELVVSSDQTLEGSQTGFGTRPDKRKCHSSEFRLNELLRRMNSCGGPSS